MYEHEPQFIVDYYDKKYDVKGYFVVDTLINGIAGGGIRIRKDLTVEEVVHLAKKMTLKFTFINPHIGGAKCGLDFDVNGAGNDEIKEEVLDRFVQFLEPFLRGFYATGPDINTSGKEIMKSVLKLGVPHPQYALAKKSPMGLEKALDRLQKGVNIPVRVLGKETILNDVVAGFSVMEAAKTACFLDGSSFEEKKIAIEGFGSVGGSAAHFLTQEGASVVAISDIDCTVYHQGGLDLSLVTGENFGHININNLPENYTVIPASEGDIYSVEEDIDVFIPAARSDYITAEKLDLLMKNLNPQYIIPGANHPFLVSGDKDEGYIENWLFSKNVIVIPDFIANAGAAALFGILTWNEKINLTADSLLRAVAVMIRESTVKVMASSETERLSPFEVSIAQSRKKIVEYYSDYSSKF